MGQFYEDEASLFVEAYDAVHQGGSPATAGDVALYAEIGRMSAGPILEIACGTGRITLPLAESGLDITGVDLSEGMLAIARRKAQSCSQEARQRLRFVCQDMTRLALDTRFAFVFVPFRSFQHLLSGDDQKQALTAIHRHLGPGGRLALHLFDPRLDLLIEGGAPIPDSHGADPVTGRRYRGALLRTGFDHVAQIRRDLWRYTEIDANGATLRRATREMALRWTYRWELHHLLTLCGFVVEEEYSDFQRSAPAYGNELIVVCSNSIN